MAFLGGFNEMNNLFFLKLYGGYDCLKNIGVSVKCLWENKIAKEGQPLLQ